jgi:hypothetical protein
MYGEAQVSRRKQTLVAIAGTAANCENEPDMLGDDRDRCDMV